MHRVNALHYSTAEEELSCTVASKMRQPGVEPGSIAWKATMLTATPPTLNNSKQRIFILF